jgi:cytochrome c6
MAGILVLAACTSAFGCAGAAPAAERAPVDGAALFGQACAKCHGADGTGGLPSVANGPRPVDLTAATWHATRSDAEVLNAIRDGRGAMPPFNGVLSAGQIDALAAYVRSLKKP